MLPTFETTVRGYLFPFYHRPCNLKMLYTASLKLNIFRKSQKDSVIQGVSLQPLAVKCKDYPLERLGYFLAFTGSRLYPSSLPEGALKPATCWVVQAIWVKKFS